MNKMKKSAANDGDDGDVKDVHDLLVMLQYFCLFTYIRLCFVCLVFCCFSFCSKLIFIEPANDVRAPTPTSLSPRPADWRTGPPCSECNGQTLPGKYL